VILVNQTGGVRLINTVRDMSSVDSERSNNTAAAWLAAGCAVIGLVGLLWEKSFVVGKRGFDFAEGGEAQIIGYFWLLASVALLATLVPNSVLRKRIFLAITVLLFGGLLGIFGYFVYALR